MKFSELSPGTEFVFEGERYIKVSPLMAHHAVTGVSRLIHRSASVAAPGAEANAGAHSSLPETVGSVQVIAALDELCLRIESDLDQLDGDRQATKARVEALRQSFLRALKLAD